MMRSVYYRYDHDPVFRRLVDLLEHQLEDQDGLIFTPSELREAVLLASMRYESRHVRPVLYDPLNGSIRTLDAHEEHELRRRHEWMGAFESTERKDNDET